MAERYGFFNSVDGDRTYNADDFNNILGGIINETGVQKRYGQGLKPSRDSQNFLQVNVGTGRAYIDGLWYENTTTQSFDFSSASLGYQSIFIRLDYVNRELSMLVIPGDDIRVPARPEDTSVLKYLCLCDIYVNSNESYVQVADQRGTDLCPWITVLSGEVPASNVNYDKSGRSVTAQTELEYVDEYLALLSDVLEGNYITTDTAGTGTISENIQAGGVYECDINVYKSGYVALGVVGIALSGANSGKLAISRFTKGTDTAANTVTVIVSNPTNQTITLTRVSVYVLYKKGGMIRPTPI